MKLIIIGNGFDIAHGLETKYENFKEFLNKENKELKNKMTNFFQFDNDEWNQIEDDIENNYDNFETYLSGIDSDIYIDENDWDQKPHKIASDRAYVLDEEVSSKIPYKKELQEWLQKWIVSVGKYKKISKNIQNILKDSYIINFNYTTEIERKYKYKKMIYIHGNYINSQTIQFGYFRKNELKHELNFNDNFGEGWDYSRFYKNNFQKEIQTNIQKIKDFLCNKKINKIYVAGFSIGSQDKYYFSDCLLKLKDLQDIFIINHNNQAKKIINKIKCENSLINFKEISSKDFYKF